MQVYTNKSNATRAARKLRPDGSFDVLAVDGGFAISLRTQKPQAARRAQVRNGVRQPLKGVCADLWAQFAQAPDATVADVQLLAVANHYNVNNAKIEFYAFRKYHA